VLGAVFACAALVAGLRGPGERREAIALEAASAPEAAADEIDVSWVPSDAVGIAAFRPAAIFSRPELEELGTFVDRQFAPSREGTATDFEQIVAMWLHKPDPAKREPGMPTQTPLVMMRFVERAKAEELMAKMSEKATVEEKKYDGVTYRLACREDGAALQPDERTILVGNKSDVDRVIRSRGGPVPAVLGGNEGWLAFRNDHAVLAADESATKGWFEQVDAVEAAGSAAIYGPLRDNVTRAMLGLRLDDQMRIRVVATCNDEEGASRVEETLRAILVLGRNWATGRRARPDQAPEGQPDAIESTRAAEDLLGSITIRREGSVVQGEASGEVGLLASIGPLMSFQRASQETQARNNLKQIALAMHMFHDTYRRLPPAVLEQTTEQWQEAKPYSWRVALLPFLNQQDLYQQYRFDEPWDSPANLQVLEKMPDVYRAAGDPPDSTSTSYFVLVGPGAVFPEAGAMPLRKGTGFREIRDGTANTLLVVEAKRSVPWTKPEDIPYDPAKPLPELGGHFEGGFLAALCDGSVRFLPKDLDEAVLRKLIEKADGQPVDLSKIRGQDPRRAAVRRALKEKSADELEEPAPTLAPVSGTITLDGTPLPGATIRLIPTAGQRAAIGLTDDSGKYVLTTSQEGDGAAPGIYRVTISATALPGARSRPRGEYSDPKTSPLAVQVAPGNNVFDFALQSE